MELWRILVLALLQQGINCDFDRLAELANKHLDVRRMLGIWRTRFATGGLRAHIGAQCQPARTGLAGDGESASGAFRIGSPRQSDPPVPRPNPRIRLEHPGQCAPNCRPAIPTTFLGVHSRHRNREQESYFSGLGAFIKPHMIRIVSQALDTAIEKMSALPPEVQDRIARWVLGELQDEERWTQAFSNSQDALGRLADEARTDIRAGRAAQLDLDKL